LVSDSNESQFASTAKRLLLRISTVRVILAVFLAERSPRKSAERRNKEILRAAKDTGSWQGPRETSASLAMLKRTPLACDGKAT
jgi:hypothetical protein